MHIFPQYIVNVNAYFICLKMFEKLLYFKYIRLLSGKFQNRQPFCSFKYY